MKYASMGVVKGGAFHMRDRDAFLAAFKAWPDGDVWASFEAAITFRTREQNRYWHAAIVRPLAAHCHVTPRQMHEALKVKLLPETITILDRDRLVLDAIDIGGTTTTLSQSEAANLIDRGDAIVVAAGVPPRAPEDAPPAAPQPAAAPVGAVCPSGTRHWWYWIRPNVQQCKHCQAVRYAPM
jgi:hypothetical protein